MNRCSFIRHGQVRALLLLALASLLTACSREAARESPEAVKQFGYGPRPGPQVRYQPDVVMIGGGASAVRGVSDDGLTWTIDGSAKGAQDLSVGKIMFATSRAVGRVLAIEPRGKDLAVKLGPVTLTQIIRDAKIDINEKLPPDAFVSYASAPPQDVLHYSRIDRGNSGLEPVAWRQRAIRPRLQPAGFKGSAKVTFGIWEFEPYIKSSGREWYQPDPDAPPKLFENNALTPGQQETKVTAFGLKVQRKLSAGKVAEGAASGMKYGIKFGADIRLIGSDIRTYGHVSIRDGKVDEPVTFVIEGVDELDIGLLGGAENGTADNFKLRVEIPVEKAFSLPPAGPVPLAMHLKMKFLVEFAFSGANSTMWATGQYKLDGPLGIVNGAAVTPSFTVIKPMINDIHGITVGVSGIVMASEFRWLLGVGNELFQAGPYGKIIVAVGTSRGSFASLMIGGPLSNPLHPKIDCRGVTIKGDLGLGFGVVIDENWSKLLDKYHLKTDSEIVEWSKTFVNHTLVSPVSPVCSEGSGGGGSPF